MNAPGLVESYLESLARIEAAVRERADGFPGWVVVPTVPTVEIAAVELELGFALPEEVNSLYRATGSIDCFFDFLTSIARLVQVTEEARIHVAEVEEDFGDRIWGPTPAGNVMVVGMGGGFVNFYEIDGPMKGRLSRLNMNSDFGYRFLANSIGQLLHAWVTATERGLFELTERGDIFGPSSLELELRNLASELGVGPTAFGISHLTPEQMIRMRAGEPNFWLD